MVIDRASVARKSPSTRARRGPSGPTKINASTRFDFAGKNLTAYGGLLPVATLLENCSFSNWWKKP